MKICYHFLNRTFWPTAKDKNLNSYFLPKINFLRTWYYLKPQNVAIFLKIRATGHASDNENKT